MRRLAVFACALALVPSSATGQPAPRPSVSLDLETGQLAIGIPEGWRLYAPAAEALGLDGEAPAAFAPPSLQVHTTEGAEITASLGWPAPERVGSAGSHTWVYTERLVARLPADGVGAGTLLLRWALCNDELCIPGTTRIDPD